MVTGHNMAFENDARIGVSQNLLICVRAYQFGVSAHSLKVLES